MACRFIILCLAFIQMVYSQYYTAPASTTYSPYGSYYPSAAPTYPPSNPPRSLPQPPPKTPKAIVPNTQSIVKCSPETARAYFLNPIEKAQTLAKEKSIAPKYSCPLCNNFADVTPNSKIPPPPPIGAPVLPGVIEKVPTIVLPKNLTASYPTSIIPKNAKFTDMCEKHKVKNLSFDQDLLEGFLTGLGL